MEVNPGTLIHSQAFKEITEGLEGEDFTTASCNDPAWKQIRPTRTQ